MHTGVLLADGPVTLTRHYAPSSRALHVTAAVTAWALLGLLVLLTLMALAASLADANLPLESGCAFCSADVWTRPVSL